METPHSILVCRLSALGDVVLTLPVLRALRRAFPDAHVAYLSREPFGRILHGSPDVDELVLWPGPGRPLAPEVTARTWDVVVDLSATGRSRRLLRGVKTRRRLRADKDTWARFRLVKLRWLGGEGRIRPAVDRLFAAIEPLGIRRDGLVPAFESEQLAPRDGSAVVLAPGGGRAAKQWPAERFAEVARELSDRGARVVLVGSADEAELLARVAASIPDDRVEVHAGPDPSDLPAIVSRGRVALTNDSGILHVAEAAGVPVVALFGPTHPRLGFAPLGGGSVALHTGISCSPCDLHGPERCPKGHHRCLGGLETRRVLAEILPRLGEGETS